MSYKKCPHCGAEYHDDKQVHQCRWCGRFFCENCVDAGGYGAFCSGRCSRESDAADGY